MKCEWLTTEEVDDEHGHRRWQICMICGAERKQRHRDKEWETVWKVSPSTAPPSLRDAFALYASNV